MINNWHYLPTIRLPSSAPQARRAAGKAAVALGVQSSQKNKFTVFIIRGAAAKITESDSEKLFAFLRFSD